jgi:hypothetical protein
MFVYYAFEDQGSGLVIQGYTEAARAIGHEVCVYGRDNPKIPLNYSIDVGSADAIIFLFEWTTQLRYEDQLDMLRLMTALPRERRVILDGDGNYNDPFLVENDYNHKDAASSRRWCEICDSVTDKICQPTLHPFRKHVRPFLFYAYNPSWEVPLSSGTASKEYGMIYVGHAKFRWWPMSRVLRAVEKVRGEVGRIGLVGHGWGELPWWATTMKIEDSYYTEPDYLKKLGAEVMPPVPFKAVVETMSKATFNPVLLRPTFNTMKLVNPRMFETPAANTIPLFAIDKEHIREIYGEDAANNLVLHDGAPDAVANIVRRPDDFRDIQLGMRKHLAEHHSHAARLRQLIEIIKS